MQEFDTRFRRAKLSALIYRSMARRIENLPQTLVCSEEDRAYAEGVVAAVREQMLELAAIHDPQQTLLGDDY